MQSSFSDVARASSLKLSNAKLHDLKPKAKDTPEPVSVTQKSALCIMHIALYFRILIHQPIFSILLLLNRSRVLISTICSPGFAIKRLIQ